jgi:hypothetical protein
MLLVALNDAKAHLRIIGDAEDAILTTYCQAASEFVHGVVAQEWEEDVPASVRVAALLIVGDLYENREAQSPVVLHRNETVMRLLYPYRSWGGE